MHLILTEFLIWTVMPGSLTWLVMPGFLIWPVMLGSLTFPVMLGFPVWIVTLICPEMVGAVLKWMAVDCQECLFQISEYPATGRSTAVALCHISVMYISIWSNKNIALNKMGFKRSPVCTVNPIMPSGLFCYNRLDPSISNSSLC